MAVNFIDRRTLASLLITTKGLDRTFAVIDVRDADFEGGHIEGAINVPSETFATQLGRLLAEELHDKDEVIVHCMMSQQRGPYCANLLVHEIQKKGLPGPKVRVLKGGFNGWVTEFRNSNLIVSYDAKVWGGSIS